MTTVDTHRPATAVPQPSAPTAGASRTYLRDVAALPPAPTTDSAARRRPATVTAGERVVGIGSAVAALALAWLICYQLLPWGSVLGFVVVAMVLYLALVTVTTSVLTPGPAVADRVAAAAISGGAAVVGIALVSAVAFIFVRAGGALVHLNLVTQDMSGVTPRDPLTNGGVLHAMAGTVIEITIAVAVTVPLALGTAVYMTEVGGGFARVIRTVVEAMTALPSVVAGLFIYSVLLLTLGMSRSGFAAAMALAVMMLPIIARAADVVLRVVPSGLREASLALGASRWRTVWNVVLPTARPGLATALILGVARGVGETSPVLLTSGATTFLVLTPIGQQMNSLPLFVFTSVRSGEPLMIQRGFAAAAVLLALVLGLFVLARYLARPRNGRS